MLNANEAHYRSDEYYSPNRGRNGLTSEMDSISDSIKYAVGRGDYTVKVKVFQGEMTVLAIISVLVELGYEVDALRRFEYVDWYELEISWRRV